MPIPFAILTSESNDETWNLQIHFWENAVEHFDRMCSRREDYESGEYNFGVDACMVVILAATSITQLLGQQYKGNKKRIPPPLELLSELLGGDVPANYEDFLDTYDDIRHFGVPKHDRVRGLADEAKLCSLLTTAQDIWHKVATHRGASLLHDSHLFGRTFTFPSDDE